MGETDDVVELVTEVVVLVRTVLELLWDDVAVLEELREVEVLVVVSAELVRELVWLDDDEEVESDDERVPEVLEVLLSVLERDSLVEVGETLLLELEVVDVVLLVRDEEVSVDDTLVLELESEVDVELWDVVVELTVDEELLDTDAPN